MRRSSLPASRIVLSCEHGGNRVPRAYAALFRGARQILDSHRGWDPGALAFARALSRSLGAPLQFATTSRLLVELNRSLHHRRLFSEFSRDLAPADKERILARYYLAYREALELELAAGPFPVLHLAVHTFTPVLDGVTRDADFALLYDPSRALERAAADRWLASLGAARPDLRLRRNYPYRGTADGLTTALRRRFPASRYAGIEIEINQALATRAVARRALVAACTDALRAL